jgi:hypothetical protein
VGPVEEAADVADVDQQPGGAGRAMPCRSISVVPVEATISRSSSPASLERR